MQSSGYGFSSKTLFTGGGLAGAATAFLSGGWFVAGVATGGTIALAAFLLGMARLADSISETKSLDGESLLPYAAMGDLRAIFEHLQQNDEYEPQLLVSFAKYALQRTALGGRDARMGVSAWYYTACAAADLLSQKGKPDLERIFKEILAAGEDVEIGRFRHNLAAQIPLGKFIDMVKLLPHAPKALRLLEEYTNIDLSSFVDEIEIKWRKNMIVDKGDVEWLVSKGNNSVINWLFDAAIYHHNDSASEALEWLANEKGNVLARELLKIPMPE